MYTATDLNGHNGPRTVAEAAREPVRLALLDTDGHTGTFSNDAGVFRGERPRGRSTTGGVGRGYG